MKRIILFFVVAMFVGAGVVWANDRLEYKLTMNKNDRLCSHMRDVLNKDLRAYGRGYDSHKFQDFVFQAIPWTERGKDFDYYGKVARFDINNDGQVDVVVRQETSGGKDITFDKLFIFNDAQYPAAARKSKDLEEKSIGFVDASFVYIYPFIFDKTTYLLLVTSPDSSHPQNFEIAKYKGGKIGIGVPGQLEDVCFLQ